MNALVDSVIKSDPENQLKSSKRSEAYSSFVKIAEKGLIERDRLLRSCPKYQENKAGLASKADFAMKCANYFLEKYSDRFNHHLPNPTSKVAFYLQKICLSEVASHFQDSSIISAMDYICGVHAMLAEAPVIYQELLNEKYSVKGCELEYIAECLASPETGREKDIAYVNIMHGNLNPELIDGLISMAQSFEKSSIAEDFIRTNFKDMGDDAFKIGKIGTLKPKE